MKYRNTKTGAVIETATAINGGNWVEVNGGGVKANDASQITRKVNNKTSVFDRMK